MGSQRVGHDLVPEQQQQFYIELFEPPVFTWASLVDQW